MHFPRKRRPLNLFSITGARVYRMGPVVAPRGSHPLLRVQRSHLQVLDQEQTRRHHARQVQPQHDAFRTGMLLEH